MLLFLKVVKALQVRLSHVSVLQPELGCQFRRGELVVGTVRGVKKFSKSQGAAQFSRPTHLWFPLLPLETPQLAGGQLLESEWFFFNSI